MNVEVRLYGALRRYRPADAPGLPHTPFFVELPPNATIEILGQQLHIPDGLISAAAVDNQAVDTAYRLHANDRVGLFPPSAGGSSPSTR